MTAVVHGGNLGRWFEELCRIKHRQLREIAASNGARLNAEKCLHQGGVYVFWWTGERSLLESKQCNRRLELSGPGGRQVAIEIDDEWLGLDADLLSRSLGMKVSKFAVQGAKIADRFAMIRYFLSEHPEVRLLVYDVESTLFSEDRLSTNSYRLFFSFIDNPEMAYYVRAHAPSDFDYWMKKIIMRTSRFSEVTVALAFRGWLGMMNQNLKFGKLDTPTK